MNLRSRIMLGRLRLLLGAGLICCMAEGEGLATTAVRPVTTPFIRGSDALSHMRVDPKGRFIAYVGDSGLGLYLVDLKSKGIFQVSGGQIGASFVWSPDGYRLLYREQSVAADGQISSEVKAYDAALATSVTLDKLAYPTGFLTLDPRDLRLQLLGPQGIHTKRIYFPGQRLARWQIAQRNENGKFLATQQGMLWETQAGFALRRLDDDQSGVESFDISPEGASVAWATKAGRVYISKGGKTPRLIGQGRDPRWHPDKPMLVYSGARMVGNTVIGYDLRLADEDGAGRFLTSTQFVDERWPQWHPRGHQIIYTIAKTTDIFLLDFTP